MATSIRPHSPEFRVPRGYTPPTAAEWEAITQRDIWDPDKRVPASYVPEPSELLWEPAGGPLVAPLGNYGVTATPPQLETIQDARREAEREAEHVRSHANRRLRYSLRNASQALSEVASVCRCGRMRRKLFGSEATSIDVVMNRQGGAHFAGLVRCASPWVCPVCMYRISRGRSEEVRALVQRHRDTGGGVYMLTLTLPHDMVDSLGAMRRHVSWAWSKVQAGSAYKRMRSRMGLVGTVRALEVTNGPAGWHPHLHILVLTKEPLEHAASGKLGKLGQAYETMVYRRWVRMVTTRNKESGKAYRAPSREHGISFVQSRRDDYIAKLGLADELTRGSWKKSRDFQGYRTPLQVLRDIAACRDAKLRPEARDVAIWKEYAKEMHGARQLTWSRGLRNLYDLGDEQTDMELADSEDADLGKVLYTIDGALWDRYFRNNWSARCELLAGAELRGWDGVQAIVDRVRGLDPVPF